MSCSLSRSFRRRAYSDRVLIVDVSNVFESDSITVDAYRSVPYTWINRDRVGSYLEQRTRNVSASGARAAPGRCLVGRVLFIRVELDREWIRETPNFKTKSKRSRMVVSGSGVTPPARAGMKEVFATLLPGGCCSRVRNWVKRARQSNRSDGWKIGLRC